jgi:hypothetical protein
LRIAHGEWHEDADPLQRRRLLRACCEGPEAMKPRAIPITSSSKLLEVKPTKVGACGSDRLKFGSVPVSGALSFCPDATSKV